MYFFLLCCYSAVFTTEEGLTCATQLSTVKVTFEDVFQPVAMEHFQKVGIFIRSIVTKMFDFRVQFGIMSVQIFGH